MADGPYNLAIETSGPRGSVTLGRGEALLHSLDLPEQRRHRVDLMPTIDTLCRAHGVTPRDLGEVYVSAGPGSFTGLRIAIATAKALAQALGVRLVAVPTIEALAQSAPPSGCTLAVCLAVKGDTFYSGLFAWDGELWVPQGEPALRTMEQLLASARPGAPGLALLGQVLPEAPPAADVQVLPPELAIARSDAVWRLGRARARAGDFVGAQHLLPLYVRPPEAEELWKKRQAAVR